METGVADAVAISNTHRIVDEVCPVDADCWIQAIGKAVSNRSVNRIYTIVSAVDEVIVGIERLVRPHAVICDLYFCSTTINGKRILGADLWRTRVRMPAPDLPRV